MEKGFDAVSTTDIARKVGCNQALVHYYFRTKDNLFLQVFLQKFSIIMSKISSEITPNEHDFFVILDRFIDTYFEMLSENRTLPFFLVNELLLRPERREIVPDGENGNWQRHHPTDRNDGPHTRCDFAHCLHLHLPSNVQRLLPSRRGANQHLPPSSEERGQRTGNEGDCD